MIGLNCWMAGPFWALAESGQLSQPASPESAGYRGNMPVPYVVTLVAVVVTLVGLRVAKWMPGRRLSRHVAVPDLALIVVGTLGLALHCMSMFYRNVVDVVPGSMGLVAAINAMGTTSVVLFVVPAIFLLIGLRHQRPAVVVVELLALAAVGVTMYDGGSTTAHLVAISVSVTVLAVIATQLIRPPWRRPGEQCGLPETTHRRRPLARIRRS